MRVAVSKAPIVIRRANPERAGSRPPASVRGGGDVVRGVNTSRADAIRRPSSAILQRRARCRRPRSPRVPARGQLLRGAATTYAASDARPRNAFWSGRRLEPDLSRKRVVCSRFHRRQIGIHHVACSIGAWWRQRQRASAVPPGRADEACCARSRVCSVCKTPKSALRQFGQRISARVSGRMACARQPAGIGIATISPYKEF